VSALPITVASHRGLALAEVGIDVVREHTGGRGHGEPRQPPNRMLVRKRRFGCRRRAIVCGNASSVVGTREDVLLGDDVGFGGACSLCVDAEWVTSS
jgi:hypothetical protein